MNEWYPRFGSGEMGLHDLFFCVSPTVQHGGFVGQVPTTLQVTINMMEPKPDWRRMFTV